MKLALHFDAMHAELGNPYHLPAQQLVFTALLAQRDNQIDSRIFTGDLLFTHVPGLKAADAVGLWFFPENPVWTSPNGVEEWNLPPHMRNPPRREGVLGRSLLRECEPGDGRAPARGSRWFGLVPWGTGSR